MNILVIRKYLKLKHDPVLRAVIYLLKDRKHTCKMKGSCIMHHFPTILFPAELICVLPITVRVRPGLPSVWMYCSKESSKPFELRTFKDAQKQL
jgi:hypothetical protein